MSHRAGAPANGPPWQSRVALRLVLRLQVKRVSYHPGGGSQGPCRSRPGPSPLADLQADRLPPPREPARLGGRHQVLVGGDRQHRLALAAGPGGREPHRHRGHAPTAAGGVGEDRRPPEQVERRSRSARELNTAQYLKRAAQARAWPARQLRLLGTAPDEAVAARIGRMVNAVRVRRTRLAIPGPGGHGWTQAELALLGTAPDEEVAARVGRTPGAVGQKRCKLGVPTFRNRRPSGDRGHFRNH
jgi:hypothetical protein